MGKNMIQLKDILNENKETEREIFEDLKGSYSLQGHFSIDRSFELKNTSKDIVNLDVPSNKPNHTLWTSTVFKDLDTFSTKWLKMVKNPDNYISWGQYFHVYTIQNNPDIFHAHNKADKQFLLDNYLKLENKYGDKYLNWEKIWENYDAFHVTQNGTDNIDMFDSWGIESTAWFRPKDYLKEQFVWKVET